ncbi:MAG: sugar phosphate isomerase/epimerase [Anaerolineaceae bacterium]|nr:sugar phosphate isomerase/epimerase [Anaerolineaceae bacterium]
MSVTLSAFGDEIAQDLDDQLAVLNELGVPGLDLRAAWGINVLQLSDDQARQARAACDAAGIRVSALGSPVGKSPLDEPVALDEQRIRRLVDIGDILACSRIRIFSWYPEDTSGNDHYDQYVPQVIDRLAALTTIAADAGFTLLHENERHIVGDRPERVQAFAEAIDSPHFRLIWDPANYVQVGVLNSMQYFDAQADRVDCVHVKDSRADNTIVAAGEGEGQFPELMVALRERNFDGVLALEPHLKLAAHSIGFSGTDGMTRAVKALRRVMADSGLEEAAT